VSSGNRRGMFLIGAVVMILVIVLLAQSRHLVAKNEAYAEQIQSLEEQITEEYDRAEQNEEFREYTKTDAYIEKVAREKFGLVYPDETIFKTR